VLWFPGWAVTAWALSEGVDASRPIAVVAANRVVACSPEASAEGVVTGQRRREAQSRCPGLAVLIADEGRDNREFARVVECVEQLAPGVQVVRPGVCALRARGFASYLGSEAEAAEVLLEAVSDLGITTGRAGVADGLFAALQAAYAGDPVRIVLPGGSAGFVAPLPVSRLGDEALNALLPRLGIHTLGEFAALGAAAARDRFGRHGERLHALASGADPRAVQPRVPPPELVRTVDFEPPLTLVDQVAFTARATVEEFIAALTATGLACTELRVELTGERDEFLTRTWGTPTMFDAPAVIDRIRWQLQAAAGRDLHSAVTSLRLEPVAVDALANHEPGLFGNGPDQRVHHVLSRVQAMLGHDGVLTPQVGGGRWLAERQVLVPWGDRAAAASAATVAAAPWPGSLPDPLPSAVFTEPRPVLLLARDGTPVSLDGRGQLRGVPTVLRDGAERRTVIGWAGPWPIDERVWDPARARSASRFQVVDGTGTAWLLVLEGGAWWAEGRYD
jgi:protein ImuB